MTHRNMNRSQTEIFHLVKAISNHLPIGVVKKLFKRQESALHFLHSQEIQRINKKINRLTQKNTENLIKNITPIKYHSLHLGNINDNENNDPDTDNHLTLSSHSSVNGGIEIKIEPSIFKNNIPGSSLTSTKNNCIVVKRCHTLRLPIIYILIHYQTTDNGD